MSSWLKIWFIPLWFLQSLVPPCGKISPLPETVKSKIQFLILTQDLPSGIYNWQGVHQKLWLFNLSAKVNLLNAWCGSFIVRNNSQLISRLQISGQDSWDRALCALGRHCWLFPSSTPRLLTSHTLCRDPRSARSLGRFWRPALGRCSRAQWAFWQRGMPSGRPPPLWRWCSSCLEWPKYSGF